MRRTLHTGMTTFQDALSAAHAAIKANAGVTINYKRDATEIELTALVGMTTFQVGDHDGYLVSYESKDFIFAASDISALGLPQRGDKIEHVISDDTWIYEVMRPDGGEDVYRITDAGRQIVRVHTKLISVTT